MLGHANSRRVKNGNDRDWASMTFPKYRREVGNLQMGLPDNKPWRRFSHVLAAAAICLAASTRARGETFESADGGYKYSLAERFSRAKNRTAEMWSYRLLDGTIPSDSSPLLESSSRTSNELWGADFDTLPRMRSDTAGYRAIGRNDSGRELVSTQDESRWSPGEILVHPKGGDAPAGLAIWWTAPRDARYSFALAASGSKGVGLGVARRAQYRDRSRGRKEYRPPDGTCTRRCCTCSASIV
jgi:hypothetical protein